MDSVAGELLGRAVPALPVAAGFGSLTERFSRPPRLPGKLALNELIDKLSVFARDLLDRGREAVAFLADCRGVAELPAEGCPLCEDTFELVLGAGER